MKNPRLFAVRSIAMEWYLPRYVSDIAQGKAAFQSSSPHGETGARKIPLDTFDPATRGL